MQKLAWEYLRDTVRATPDKVAVCEGEERITFGCLWDRAVALATRLREDSGQPVVIDMPKSIRAVVAIVAAQLAGAV
jgi:acyl-CoA synthetase (AMP-forming)/AMP-acid ligase II